jgi:tRNA(fMet)-specific endonuclease VapC
VSLRYLLDTNVLSEPVRPQPNTHVLERLAKRRELVCTAAPVWHELAYGCRRLPESKRRRELTQYIEQVLAPTLVVLPYDAAAAAWHAGERARLTALGKTPAFVDGQIAAVAKVNDLVLVTANVKDFDKFEALPFEDWTLP